MVKITSSEITPQRVYQSRRAFMKGLGVSAAGALLLAACGPQSDPAPASTEPAAVSASAAAREPAIAPSTPGAGRALMPDESLTDVKAVTGYNNFYEFSTDKEAVAFLSDGFKTSPWTVTVGGLVNKPKTFGIQDILAKYTQEERVYRMRCVEGWSMVIPWLGFPLSALLKEVEPSSGAKYVRFETLLDPLQLPGQRDTYYPWPYTEGLRLDEAMHNLTILSTGLYGQSLLPQNGAPLRLVVPWKYGFKSIKSIVKIDLVDVEPRSLWMDMAPHEYGFYANVNPDVAHPRWSQASERRIGELGRRRTMPFNGYGDEVASLYAGMDLRKSF